MMDGVILSVREIETKDIELIVNYWLKSDGKFLEGMGVDLSKIPSKEEWVKMLSEQISQPVQEKKSYCIIWEVDGEAVGHSNINKIKMGEEAYMHLHLWNGGTRQKGMGAAFVKMTLPHYFEKFRLKKLYCEPYALNPAPNKTLPKAGFEFVKSYVSVPGILNFEQQVNLWEMNRDSFEKLK